MTTTYSGAYRSSCAIDGGIHWIMSADNAELLRCADEDGEQVLWASTPEELYCLLEERYPGRCLRHADGCSVYPYPVVTADGLPDDGNRDDAFAARIVAAAAKHGTVWVYDNLPDKIPAAVWESCVRGDHPSIVIYDPVAAQKRKISKTRADQKRPLPTSCFYGVTQQLHHFLWRHLDLNDVPTNGSRIDYIYRLHWMLWLCERLYGKRSYRRLACWHEFVAGWQRRRKPTEEALARAIADLPEGYREREVVAEFVAFMARECQRRLPPVAADDEVRTCEPRLPH